MLKKCKNEVVTINYKGLGNTEYTCISAISYHPDEDVLIIIWDDSTSHLWNAASDNYGFILFEDGTEWNFNRA